MSSYFVLELDTESPQAEIYAPSYTAPTTLTEITIQANESLLDNAEIYVIDSEGTRYDYTFLHNDDKFIGHIYFNNMAIGVATLYATVYDEVLNKSSLMTKSFNIIKSEILKINISVVAMQEINTGASVARLDIKTSGSTKSKSTIDEMKIVTDTKGMRIDVTKKVSEVS